MSSPSPPPPPLRKFILRSYDGKSYELEGKAALESRMIRDMIEDECPDDVIPVPVPAPGDILDKVVVYCQNHAECDVIPVPSPDQLYRRVPSPSPSPLERELLAWDRDFVRVDRATLSHLCRAVNYLNIDSLLDAICQSLADKIHGKTPKEGLDGWE